MIFTPLHPGHGRGGLLRRASLLAITLLAVGLCHWLLRASHSLSGPDSPIRPASNSGCALPVAAFVTAESSGETCDVPSYAPGEPTTYSPGVFLCSNEHGELEAIAADDMAGYYLGQVEPSPAYWRNIAYMLENNSRLKPEAAIEVLDNYYMAVSEYPELPLEETVAAFVCIAHYESHWRVGASGPAGERGTLQTHPLHRRSFTKAGLSFDSELDRCRYWAGKVAGKLANGSSWWGAFSPWAVTKGSKGRKVRAQWGRFVEALEADNA